MKNSFYILTAIISLSGFTSCEKVINVDVKDSEKRIVIEGVISDAPGLVSHTILISKTNSFSAPNVRNPISNAVVFVRDINAGVTDTLLEIKPGEYLTQKTYGVPGHTYNLTAIVEGKTYNASSTMPQVVPFDSIYTQNFSFFGETFVQVIPVFTDPAGVKNYYRFSVQANDSLDKAYQAWDDLISDGKENSRPLFSQTVSIDPKDTVTIFMDCTDKSTYDFFYTLENASGNAQTPANPISNISNNGMGYFTAINRQKKVIIIPE